VHQLGQLNLESPAEKLMVSMPAEVAEMARDLLVERTKVGLERVKAEGRSPGRSCNRTRRSAQR
jgi:DNA invertase Pin-like site-specific DNA recombinase